MSLQPPLDLLFLGSGNAFGADGRAYSSFLLNRRYLFDCGPTLLPQLRRAGLGTHDIDVVFITHFHADHFFGLPFLFLDARYSDRAKDLWIAGPPGIEERTEALLSLGYHGLQAGPEAMTFPRRYIEVSDGMEAVVAGLGFTAASVEHVSGLDCFAYRTQLEGRSLVYSGDTTLCDGLLRLVPGADVLVLEYSAIDVPVHLGPSEVTEVVRHTSPGAQVVLTHLDGHQRDHPLVESLAKDRDIYLASDLARFRF